MASSTRNLPDGHFDFFITSRCHNKEWFNVPLMMVWEVFSRYLYFIRHAHGVSIRAFVLMSNHYHMICSADSSNLPKAMAYFQRECSKEINRLTGSVNQVWGRPYHSSILSSYFHYMNAYKYTLRNPVEAGLCSRVESYPYSSVNGLLGQSHLLMPVEDEILTGDFEAQLSWLNRKPARETYRDDMKKALRRRHSQFGQAKSSAPHPYDSELI